jgi:hypothetical protein
MVTLGVWRHSKIYDRTRLFWIPWKTYEIMWNMLGSPHGSGPTKELFCVIATTLGLWVKSHWCAVSTRIFLGSSHNEKISSKVYNNETDLLTFSNRTDETGNTRVRNLLYTATSVHGSHRCQADKQLLL